jgi:hypothetical protein
MKILSPTSFLLELDIFQFNNTGRLIGTQVKNTFGIFFAGLGFKKPFLLTAIQAKGLGLGFVFLQEEISFGIKYQSMALITFYIT